jgi:methylated-DNA-[protein]-cysteine S-methyltransferase
VIEIATVNSPIGPLTIAAHAGRVCLLHLGQEDEHARAWLARWYPDMPVSRVPDPAGAVTKLRHYFAGELHTLDDIPVELNGTAFQRRVWERLRAVKAGSTASYAQVARAIGASKAVRAVGAANGANPIAIVVPCHRIIGTNGSLTGYGGGLDRKKWLLHHEGVRPGLF